MTTKELLLKYEIFKAGGELRRAIAQGAVKINGILVTDPEQEFVIGENVAFQRGKKKYLNNKEWNSLEIDPVRIVQFGKLINRG